MLHMIGHIIFGLIVGIVAKLVTPGHYHMGWIATILLGIIGAWVGGWIGRAFGWYEPGHPAGFFMAVLGAVLLLLIYGYYQSHAGATTVTQVDAPRACLMPALSPPSVYWIG